MIVFPPIFASPSENWFNFCSPNRKSIPAPMHSWHVWGSHWDTGLHITSLFLT